MVNKGLGWKKPYKNIPSLLGSRHLACGVKSAG